MSALAAAFAALHLTDRSVLRRIVDCHLECSGGSATLHLTGHSITFPVSARAALQALCDSQQITVRELVGIDDNSRLVVARRLIREGAVVAVAPIIHPAVHDGARTA